MAWTDNWTCALNSLGRNIVSLAYRIRRILWISKSAYASFWAIFVAGPPYLVAQFAGSEKFANAVAKVDPELTKVLDEHIVVFVILAAAWIAIFERLKRVLLSFLSPVPAGWERAPSFILKALDEIVGYKTKRHNDSVAKYFAAKSNGKRGPNAQQVLDDISKPEAQINRIVEQVYLFAFKFFLNPSIGAKELKVTLGVMQNGNLVKFLCYFPANRAVRSDTVELNRPSSCIQSAYREQKMIILPSVLDESEKKNPRYLITSNNDSSVDGSIICVPILTADPETGFVLSIFSPTRNAFDKGLRDTYREVLEPFLLRIQLEHSLVTIARMTT